MHRVEEMFGTHPAPASDAGDEAFALVKAASECVATCTTCADACLEGDPASMRKCIRMCQDCADVCAVIVRLISRPGEQDSGTLHAQLDACATACRACAEECESHADSSEQCRICAESCRACAEACDRMKEAVVQA